MAKSEVKRIGLFGGSFNPVHKGHLHLARFAQKKLKLDIVYFIPCRVPVFKKKSDLLPDWLRVRCLRSALLHEKRMRVSQCELRRPGVSYTVDTLKAFRRRFGSKAELFFLAGTDAGRNLSRWKSPSKVLELCRFVVLTRPGFSTLRRIRGVRYIEMPPMDVSSTKLRGQMKRGLGLGATVSPSVNKLLKRYMERRLTSIRKKKPR